MKPDLKETIEILESITKQKPKFNKYGYATLAITPQAFEVLSSAIQLLTQIRDCQGLPEKRGKKYKNDLDYGFNECLDLCTIAHIKLQQERDELKKELYHKGQDTFNAVLVGKSLGKTTQQALNIAHTLEKYTDVRKVEIKVNSTEQQDEIDELKQELSALRKECERLKKGECEHIAQNVINAGCRLCELAVVEKMNEELKAIKERATRGF